ncbi:hypothetical protein OAT67_09540 [Bacteriovoracaceae bacterium]|nr:hypothetical protein [Bacteriovoracaceae bacterium]
MFRRSSSVFILIAFCLLGSFQLQAQSFTFDHENCQIRLKDFSKKQKYLKEVLEKQLKKRNFKTLEMKDNKRVLPNELYAKINVIKLPSNLLYHPCLVELEIKVAQTRTPTESDDTLFERSVKRMFPRVTFEGEERCKRALEDAFVHIPYCKKL